MNRHRNIRVRNSAIAALLLGSQLVLSGQSFEAPRKFPASADLDTKSIQDAIAFGESGKPEPYWLYPTQKRRDAWIAVYTPFTRVALAAYTARRRGERLSAETLPNWIVERIVHVVVRPATHHVRSAQRLYPNDPPLGDTPITQIALGRHNSVPFLAFNSPRWMTTDLSYLHELGGPPFAGAVAAAGFEPELLREDVDVWGWWRKENRFFPSFGMLVPNEVRNWR